MKRLIAAFMTMLMVLLTFTTPVLAALPYPAREPCKLWDIICILRSMQSFSTIAWAPSIASWDCTRSGEDITCIMTQLKEWGCSYPNYGLDRAGACVRAGGLGVDLPDDIMSRLGETGELTDTQRQYVYDNLQIIGACQFGYTSGVWDTGECSWTRYDVGWQIYNSLACTDKHYGECIVHMHCDSCYDCSANPEYQGQSISVFLGTYGATGPEDLGNCKIVTKMAVPTPATTTTTTSTLPPSPLPSFDFLAKFMDSLVTFFRSLLGWW